MSALQRIAALRTVLRTRLLNTTIKRSQKKPRPNSYSGSVILSSHRLKWCTYFDTVCEFLFPGFRFFPCQICRDWRNDQRIESHSAKLFALVLLLSLYMHIFLLLSRTFCKRFGCLGTLWANNADSGPWLSSDQTLKYYSMFSTAGRCGLVGQTDKTSLLQADCLVDIRLT